MPTCPLPERPNLDQLRNRARELQRGVRAGSAQALEIAGLDAADPGYRLSGAQLALARFYGFASWPRLRSHVAAIADLTWTWAAPGADESPADRFLRLACVSYSDPPADPVAARSVPAPSTSLAVAAAAADADAVASLLGPDVDAPAGPYGWTPLMYLAYSRLDGGADATVRTAGLLLEAGADPNAGRYFLGYPTPFTVLTGAFGDGEGGHAAHPHALALARVLLEAGADPNDGQTLYNRMFTERDDFLELLFEFGLGQGDGGPWRRRLPDLTPAPDVMVRQLLSWAVLHGQRERVALLARNGVDVVSALPEGPGPLDGGGTPIEVATREGHRDVADLLRSVGAREPVLDAADVFVGAVLAGDAAAVAATAPDVVASVRANRPGLVVWAAQQGVAAVALAVGAGFDIDALGRCDVPVEQPWQTALHTAVERDDRELVTWLLAHGANPTVHDARFDSTPAGWAEHFDRPVVAALLAGPASG